ncbi:hypothetical protein Pla100_16640 [Neorhodopirellula pilleata]|uniref:Uncharacterized protein n=2 Tax=Neorhodopirellula pilleata TaxID=2714738 RepID=A0A5C6AQU0_9BACT|nr:hypothetical protein Pla100_16640 [Neorhodopirellula pilleata]
MIFDISRPTWLPLAVAGFFVVSFLGSPPELSAEQPGEASPTIAADLQTILAIEAEGKNFAIAQSAARRLSDLPSSEIFTVLEAMRNADPVSMNWLRGIAGNIVTRSGVPNQDALQAYIADTEHSPPGRATAMILLKAAAPDAFEQQLDASLNDPSLLIREMAVERQLNQVEALIDDQPEQAKAALRETLAAARHPVQLASVLKKLNDLGDEITTSEAFAMIETWQVIGPFDNVSGVGFDRIYPPEANFTSTGRVDLDASYEGKNSDVKWQPIQATGKEGKVDLAAAYDKEKGAVAYAYTEFESDSDREAQIRLGCICANQTWLNGKLVMSNEVYHSGSMIDQYNTAVQLKKGTNRILLKICQNEQTESWAQDWVFQCRVTDPTGKGLRPDGE